MIDDDPVNLQLLISFLNDNVYQVISFTNGQDALVWLKNNTLPDLILLDIMMPGMNGYDVCQKIRQTMPSHQLPIIFLSALDQHNTFKASNKSGANDYVTKPFSC